MNWLDHIASFPSPFKLAAFFGNQVFSEGMQPILIDAVIILTIHGFYIFWLTRLFKRHVIDTKIGYNTKLSLLFYLGMILLIIFSHIGDIFVLTWVLEALKVFPDTLTAFLYVCGIYTTVGSNFSPPTGMQSLSMVIAFIGLFAFSISGSGLYSMLSYFLDSNKGRT